MICPKCKQPAKIVRTIPGTVVSRQHNCGKHLWWTDEKARHGSLVTITAQVKAISSPPPAQGEDSPQYSNSSLSGIDPPPSEADQTRTRKSNLGAEVFEFPVDGKGGPMWAIRETQDVELSAAFPHLDVRAEYRKALLWLNAKPGRRKTARGMMSFLLNWMGNAQNRGAANHNGTNGTHRNVTVGWAPAEVKDRPSGPVEDF